MTFILLAKCLSAIKKKKKQMQNIAAAVRN